ncbi:fas-associated death domain protein isoform X1 [Leguminivora glycinivorella]|uniref:fas-associated death domain protein isoform X1 n=1 Tax=Leguminivora glycinivorella TaxID=1035111 RepID=UPI00200CFEDD|nr:fas-associated death domain protein isoform X1 [Leguminivora glycinivorella]
MVRVEVRPIHATQCRTMATNYSKLKDLITLKVSMSDMHSQILHAMKGLYQNDINSARRYEQITTIGQLLKVLEVRDVLSEENILPLQVLAQRLPDNMEIMNSISCYEQSRGPKQNINQYAVEHIHESAQRKPLPPKQYEDNAFSDGLCEKKRERITETIVEEIGSYWRNLARYLGIQEWRIDEIQCNGKPIEEKAAEIMEMYKKRADRKKWFFDLLDALEKARRKELSRKIRDIATMNI